MIKWLAVAAAVIGFCLVAFKAGVLLVACAIDALSTLMGKDSVD